MCSRLRPPLQVAEPVHRPSQLPPLLRLRSLRHPHESQLHQSRRHRALTVLLRPPGASLLPHAILLDGEDRLKNMFNVPLEFVALIVQSFRLSTSLLCRLY